MLGQVLKALGVIRIDPGCQLSQPVADLALAEQDLTSSWL